MDTENATQGLVDIDGPIQINLTTFEWSLIVLVTLVVLGGLFFLIKKFRKKKTHKKAHKTPYETATEKLQDLRKTITQKADKEFTVDVSDTLRQYLEKAFALPAPERTTEEFLNDFSDFNLISKEAAEPLAHFLKSCDLVKFAQQSLTHEQRKELIELAQKIVQTTHREKAYAHGDLQEV